MGLSCECGDFDKADFDVWWEVGRDSFPDLDERCCECNAPLDVHDTYATFLHFEVYEPQDLDTEPLPPTRSEPWPGASQSELDAYEQEWDDYEQRLGEWRDDRGWDEDCQRFERLMAQDWRCHRCQGIAEAFETLDYCLIAAGDVIYCHMEYLEEKGRWPMIWEKNADGVLNPRRMTRPEIIKRDARRRWRRFKGHVLWKRHYWRSMGVSGTIRYHIWHRIIKLRIWYPLRNKIMSIRRKFRE